ncbi:glycerate kinase [Paraburkholderia sp. GAS199]
MVAYSKNMDADSEYVPTVERSMNMWGQPKVLVRHMPWPGPGGGETQDVTMLWRQGTTEITVSFTPEGRDGKGALRYNRTASIAYVDKARVCGTK